MGLIGLGNMGSAIAERLLDAGYSLVVNNRTPEKAEALAALGADVAATPEDLVERVDVVLSSLANDAAFEEVAGKVIAAARPGTVLVDVSTVSPEVVGTRRRAWQGRRPFATCAHPSAATQPSSARGT